MDWNTPKTGTGATRLYTSPRPQTPGRGFSSRDAPADVSAERIGEGYRLFQNSKNERETSK